MARTPLAAVLQQHIDRLMTIPGVVGLAQGTWEGQLCLNIFVEDHLPQPLSGIPTRLEDYPIMLIPIGPLSVFPSS
jgi:hypothetical protein